MDIEWVMEDNILYHVQARPITTLKTKAKEKIVTDAIPLLEGLPAASNKRNS